MSSVLTPTASWAQRREVIFLTVKVPEIANPEIKVRSKVFCDRQTRVKPCLSITDMPMPLPPCVCQMEAGSLYLSCQGGSGRSYHLGINFLEDVNPQLSR